MIARGWNYSMPTRYLFMCAFDMCSALISASESQGSVTNRKEFKGNIKRLGNECQYEPLDSQLRTLRAFRFGNQSATYHAISIRMHLMHYCSTSRLKCFNNTVDIAIWNNQISTTMKTLSTQFKCIRFRKWSREIQFKTYELCKHLQTKAMKKVSTG